MGSSGETLNESIQFVPDVSNFGEGLARHIDQHHVQNRRETHHESIAINPRFGIPAKSMRCTAEIRSRHVRTNLAAC